MNTDMICVIYKDSVRSSQTTVYAHYKGISMNVVEGNWLVFVRGKHYTDKMYFLM